MSTKEEKPQTAAEMLENILTFARRAMAFWKRSMLVFVLVAGVTVPMVFLKARNYKSETIVLYQEKFNKEVVVGGESSGDGAARRAAARLKESLLSRASLEPIVKDLPRYAALAERRGMVDAVEELRQHIGFHAREGDTFEIGFEGTSPEEAQEVTRRLGEAVILEANRRSDEQIKNTREYIEKQSEGNKTKLRIAEGELWTFLGLHPEFIPQLQPGRTQVVVTTNPTAAAPGKPAPREDPVLAALQAEERNLMSRIAAGKGEAPPTAPTKPQEESEAVQAARKELAEKRQQFTEQHPDVVAAKRKLAQALEADAKRHAPAPTPAVPAGRLSDAEIQQLEQRLAIVRRSIANHHPGHGPTPAGAAAAAAAATASSNNAVTLEVEFRRLAREVENLKEVQKQLDDKLFKAQLQGGAMVEVRIVDPAYRPAHPSSKPRSTALATYLAIALILAIVIALVSARLDDRIYARRDLEALDILPVMGVIPRAGGRRAR